MTTACPEETAEGKTAYQYELLSSKVKVVILKKRKKYEYTIAVFLFIFAVNAYSMRQRLFPTGFDF